MFFRKKHTNNTGNVILKNYVKFRSSIYGRVVLIITYLSVFLFVSFSLIFRSVNEHYLNSLIRQNGNNIGSIVEGALYHSMLENDKGSLRNTLDVINTLPGIDEVNMYDSNEDLVYCNCWEYVFSYLSGDRLEHKLHSYIGFRDIHFFIFIS